MRLLGGTGRMAAPPPFFSEGFPYEVEQRCRRTCREDAEYTDMLYYYLIECGTDRASQLSDEAFHKLIQKQYLEVLDGVY